jgi:hypothetical protein
LLFLALLASAETVRGEEFFVFPYNSDVSLTVDVTGGTDGMDWRHRFFRGHDD